VKGVGDFEEDSGRAGLIRNTRCNGRRVDHAQDVVFLQTLFHKGWGSEVFLGVARGVPRQSFFFCVKSSKEHAKIERILIREEVPSKSRVCGFLCKDDRGCGG
jgi:hypothetical protein